MGTYTPNLQILEPTPGDPSITNSWGALLNTNYVLIDNAVTGVLTLSIAGSGTTILTSTAGASDQARNRLFVFTGALTGASTVLFPNGLARFFTIKNSTTGAFTLTIGANNGSGSPAGSTATIATNATAQFFSDGTNVFLDGGATGKLLQQTVFAQNISTTAFNSATPSAYLSQSFTPVSASSTIVIRAMLNYQTQIANGAGSSCAIMSASLRRAGSALLTMQLGGSAAISSVTGLTLSPLGTAPLIWQESSPGTSSVTYAIYCADVNASGLINNALVATMVIQEYL